MPTPARPGPPLWRRALRAARIAAEVLTIGMASGALLLWCSIPSTTSLASENPASTAFIDLRRSEAEGAGRKLDLKWQWKPIDKISRYLRAAVIYAEDWNFYSHDGVDWKALEQALESNLDFAARLQDRETRLIRKIERAIERLDAGEYGICASCGGDISERRLLARPVATHCIDCQTETEQLERGARAF